MPKWPKPRQTVWVWMSPRPSNPDDIEKQVIVAACEALIRDVLKPRFLPEIKPTTFNYPVDIRGAWAGGRDRFIERSRSGFADNLSEEFDAPFARIDRMRRDRFDVMGMRRTGQWRRLYQGKTLAEALHLVETDGLLHPIG